MSLATFDFFKAQGLGVKEEASSGDERGRTTRGQARAAGGEYRHAVLRDELDEHWEDELEDEDEDGSGHGSGGGGGGGGSNSRGAPRPLLLYSD